MGLVHRDVSPQNVLLTGDGDVKLCDFGIAKAVSKASQTQMGALKGKLQYMSPEQAWGRPVDARSDLFSLGAVLFEMVTGERLFTGESEISVLESVRQGQTRTPRQVDPSIPREVDEIVARALAIEPKDRFQSAGEMKQALEAALAALSPSTGPTDLALFIQRVLAPDPVGRSEPAAAMPEAPSSWPSGLAAPPAAIPPPPPYPAAPDEAIEAVAPLGAVAVEEEGGRKSRTLLYGAIAALIVIAVLTFIFLNRRKSTAPPPPPPATATATPQAPLPAAPGAVAATAAGSTAAPKPAAGTPDIKAMMDQQLAAKEAEMRLKKEQQLKDLEKQVAAAKAANPPPSAAPKAVPAPVTATSAAEPPAPRPAPAEASPAPAPVPQPEPAKAQEKPPAAEPPKPEAPRTKVGELVDAGPGVSPPQLVSAPKPEYPPMARNLRVEGTVVVSILVDENGQVQEVRMAEPIKQKAGLNEAALAAARSAHYKPATKDGVRVKMWTRLRIPFKL